LQKEVEYLSLTTLREKLGNFGAKVVRMVAMSRSRWQKSPCPAICFAKSCA